MKRVDKPLWKYRRERREYKAALVDLTGAVAAFERALDAEMKNPSSYERGSRIAILLGNLTMANQSVMHSILGYSFAKIYRLSGIKKGDK